MAKIIKSKEEIKPKKHLFYVTKCADCGEKIVIRDDELFSDEDEYEFLWFKCECGYRQLLDVQKTEIYSESEIVALGYLNQEDVDNWGSEEQKPSKETKTPKEQLINDIMERFDFERVHKTMIALNWTWTGSQSFNKVPTLDEIKDLARKQLNDAYEHNSIISVGGFTAEFHDYHDGEVRLTLRFCVEDLDTYYNFDYNEIKYY